MKIETDRVVFLSGVRGGETLGSPLALSIQNKDHENWLDRMSPLPFSSPPEPVTRPRPGHADLAGGLKYDRHDLRDVLERASARETAARTAVGGVAKKLLQSVGVEVFAHVVAIGDVTAPSASDPWPEVRARARASDLGCAAPTVETQMKEAIQRAAHAGDTLGGASRSSRSASHPVLGVMSSGTGSLMGDSRKASCVFKPSRRSRSGTDMQARIFPARRSTIPSAMMPCVIPSSGGRTTQGVSKGE
jgi:chorismate synthase